MSLRKVHLDVFISLTYVCNKTNQQIHEMALNFARTSKIDYVLTSPRVAVDILPSISFNASQYDVNNKLPMLQPQLCHEKKSYTLEIQECL